MVFWDLFDIDLIFMVTEGCVNWTQADSCYCFLYFQWLNKMPQLKAKHMPKVYVVEIYTGATWVQVFPSPQKEYSMLLYETLFFSDVQIKQDKKYCIRLLSHWKVKLYSRLSFWHNFWKCFYCWGQWLSEEIYFEHRYCCAHHKCMCCPVILKFVYFIPQDSTLL